MPLPAQRKLWISRHVVIGGLALLSACTQSPRSDVALLPGDEPVSKDTKYPDFSKPLSSAMDQMSNEEAKSMDARLSALAARRRSGAISEAEYWRRVNAMRSLRDEMPKGQTTESQTN